LNIQLTGLKSSLPSGLTRIILCYENVAGYWDGQLVAPVEKSPIVIRNGKIGIGRAQPEYPVDINADIKLQHNHTVCVDYGPWAWVNEKLISFEVPYKNDPSRGQVHLYAPTNYYENVPALTLAGNYGAGGKVGIGAKEPEDNLQIGDFGNGADTYVSVKTVGGNKFKAGLKFRHYSEDYGYTLESDETKNDFQLLGHWPGKPNVPVFYIKRILEAPYQVGIGTATPAANLHVSGGPGAAELLIEADTDNKGNESAMLTFKKKGGTTIGQLGLPDAGNTDLLLINQNSQSAIRLSGNGSVILANSTKDAFVVQTDGNTVLYRNGQPRWATNTAISDINLKTEIAPIQSPLQKLGALNGISFRWKDDCFGKNREIGLVAQEVEQVFPELMNTLDQGAKLVQYEKFVPVLIEAIKEQQKMIEKLSKQVDALVH